MRADLDRLHRFRHRLPVLAPRARGRASCTPSLHSLPVRSSPTLSTTTHVTTTKLATEIADTRSRHITAPRFRSLEGWTIDNPRQLNTRSHQSRTPGNRAKNNEVAWTSGYVRGGVPLMMRWMVARLPRHSGCPIRSILAQGRLHRLTAWEFEAFEEASGCSVPLLASWPIIRGGFRWLASRPQAREAATPP